MLVYRAEIADLPCGRIGKAQPVAADGLDGAPQAVADLEHHVVFGGERGSGPAHGLRIAPGERRQVRIEHLIQSGAVHRSPSPSACLVEALAYHNDCYLLE